MKPWEEFSPAPAPQSQPKPWEEFAPKAQPVDAPSVEKKPEVSLTQQVDQAPVSLSDKLGQKLKDWNFLNSAIEATENAPDKEIRRNADGTWDLPILSQVGDSPGLLGKFRDAQEGFMGTFDQKAGIRSDVDAGLFDGDIPQKTQDAINQFQQENNLSDEEVQATWREFGNIHRPFKNDEDLRVLNDGRLHINPLSKSFSDEDSAIKAIEKSNASPGEKVRAKAQVRPMMEQIAQRKTSAYDALAVEMDTGKTILGGVPLAGNITKVMQDFQSPSEWALENNRVDIGTPEFIKDYESSVIDDAGVFDTFMRKAMHHNVQGLYKLSNTVTGVGGLILSATEDAVGDAIGVPNLTLGGEALSRYAGDAVSSSAEAASIAPGFGFVGSILEEAPSIAAQIAIGRLLPSNIASFGAVATAGAQSAGLQFAQEVASGKTPEEARENALAAGISTAVITGIFQRAGAGGVEAVAARSGKSVGELTMRDLVNSFGEKEFKSNVLRFSKDVIKASGGEGLEEGIDQLAQFFMTADPDQKVASAWTEAEQAFGLGAFIGGVVHVGANAIEGMQSSPEIKPPPLPVSTEAATDPQVASFSNATEANLRQAGLTQTAQELRIQAANPITPPPLPSEESAQAAPATLEAPPGKTVKIGKREIAIPQPSTPVSSDSSPTKSEGSIIAEAVFGSPTKGQSYSNDVAPGDFNMVAIPGSKTRQIVTYRGSYTDRSYDTESKTFSELDPSESQVFAKKQGGILYKSAKLQVRAEQPEKPAESASLAPVEAKISAPVSKPETPSPVKESPAASPVSEPVSAPVESTSEFDEVAGSKVQFNLSTGRIEVGRESNPATSAKARKTATLSRDFVSAKGDGSVVMSQAAEWSNAVDSLMTDYPDASPDQMGKLLIARAAAGDAAAIETIQDIENPEAIAEIEKIRSSVPDLDAAAVKNLSRPLASVIDTSTPIAGEFRVSEEALSGESSPIQKPVERRRSKNDREPQEFIDSGVGSGNGVSTITNNLAIGAIVTGTKPNGETASQRVVTMTEALPNGGVRHYLRPIDQSAESLSVEMDRVLRKPVTHGYAATLMNQVSQALSTGSMVESRAQLATGVRKIVESQFSAIANMGFVRNRVEFGIQAQGVAMYQNGLGDDSKIYVNEEYLLDQLVALTQAIPAENEIGRRYAANDFAEYVAQLAYHEISHYVAVNNVPQSQLIRAVRDALGSTGSQPAFIRDARLRLKAEFAFGGGRLSQIPDADIIDLFSGKEISFNGTPMKMDSDILEGELYAVGHEMIARLQESIKTGRTYADVKQSMESWVRALTGSEGPKGKLQTMAKRLSEIANRALSAISNFFKTHRQLGDLPPAFYDLSMALDKAMSEGGFKAPDVFQVQSQALAQASDVMSHALSFRKDDFSADATVERKAKQALSRMIPQIMSAHQDGFFPVFINPQTGALIPDPRLTSGERASIDPHLQALNTQGRAETILRTQRMARDLREVLRVLNGGRAVTENSKILDTFDPGRIEGAAPKILQGVTRSLESATKLPLQTILNRVSDTILSERYTVPGNLEIGENINDVFISGFANRHREGNAAAIELNEARVAFREADFQFKGIDSDDSNLTGFQSYKGALDRLDQASENFDRIVREVAAQDSELGRSVSAILMQNESAYLNQISAIRRLNRSLPKTSSLTGLLEWYAADPANATNTMVSSGIEGGDLDLVLRDGWNTLQAYRRMRDFPQEIRYLSTGGSPPPSMKKSWETNWENISLANIPRVPIQLPSPALVASTMPLSFESSDLRRETTARMAGLSDAQGSIVIPSSHEESITFSSESAPVLSPIFQTYLDGEDFVTVRGGNASLEQEVYRPLINSVATQIRNGSTNASRLLGSDPLASNSPVLGEELLNRMKNNAWVINNQVVDQMSRENWMKQPLSPTLMRTGGFPFTTEGDRISFRDNLSSLPDVPADFFDAESPDLAFVASTLGSISDLVSEMGSNSDLLSHSSGPTPAGFAYQLIAPKLAEFFALTKNTEIEGNLSRHFEPLSDSYNRLAPDLEAAPDFSLERSRIERKGINDVMQKFWDLRRMVKVADSVYRSTIARLNDRSRREALEGRTGEDMPLSIESINQIEFETTLRAKRGISDKSTKLVSLLSPTSARTFLNQWSALDAEMQDINIFGDSNAEDGLVYALQGEGSRSDGATRAEFMEQSRIDQHQRSLETLQRKKKELRTGSLMAIMGGSRDLAMKFINHPDFRSRAIIDGDLSYDYHTDKIDSVIRQELERLDSEAVSIGAISDRAGNQYDETIRMLASLSGSEFKPVFDELLATGGWVSPISDPVSKMSVTDSGFDATPSSILSSLVGRIPGISIIQGDAQWQSSQDRDEGGPRIPTAVFIPSASSPALIFPYRSNVDIQDSDVTKAIADAVTWMADNSDVDLVGTAEKILAPIRNGLNDPLGSNFRSALVPRYERFAIDNEIVLTEEHDAIIAYQAKAWSEILNRGIDKAFEQSGRAGDLFFDREMLAQGFIPNRDQAAQIVALALTQRSVKRIIALSTTSDPNLSPPSEQDLATFGDLIGSTGVDEAVSYFADDFINSLPNGIRMIDELGMEIEPDTEDSFDVAARSETNKALDDIAEKLGLNGRQELSERGASPIIHLQSEWANNILFDALADLNPQSASATGLMGSQAERQITEMEARQFLSVMGPDYLQSQTEGELSIQSLMAIPGQAADRLRSEYNSYSITDGSEIGLTKIFNYGSFAFSDVYFRDNVDTDRYHRTRVRKGVIASARILDGMFTDDGDRIKGILNANPTALENLANSKGFQLFIGDGDSRKNVWDVARDEVFAEREASEQALQSIRDEVVSREADLLDAEAALKAIEESSEALSRSETMSSFQARVSEILRPVVTGPVLDPSIQDFFDGREEFISAMSQRLVEDAAEFGAPLVHSISAARVAGATKSHAGRQLALISIQNATSVRRAGDQIVSDVKTVSEASELTPSVSGRLRGQLNRSMIAYNQDVIDISSEISSLMPGLFNAADYALNAGMSSDQVDAAVTKFHNRLLAIRSSEELFRMAQGVAVQAAIDSAGEYDPSNGIVAQEFQGLTSNDRRIQIPQEAHSDIVAAFDGSTDQSALVDRVHSILSRHLMPMSEVSDVALTKIKQDLSNRIEGLRGGLAETNPANELLRLSREAREAGYVDSASAARIARDLYRDVMSGVVASNRAALESMMNERVKAEQPLVDRRSQVVVSTPDGFTTLMLQGHPDDVAVTQRALSYYGEIWSDLYLSNVGKSSYLDGGQDSQAAAITANERFQESIQSLSNDLGVDYEIWDDFGVPVDFDARVRALLKSKGQEVTDKSVSDKKIQLRLGAAADPSDLAADVKLKSDRLMRILEKDLKMFQSKNDSIEKAFGVFDSGKIIRTRYERMLTALVRAEKDGSMKNKGRLPLPDGSLGRDLHSQIVESLARISTEGSQEALVMANQTYNLLVSEQVSENGIDGLVAGMVPGSFFKGKSSKVLMTHNSKVRLRWAKNIKGAQAANAAFSVIEFGPDGQTGRNAHKAMHSALSEDIHKQVKKIKGNKFEILSDGNMLAVIESSLKSGFANAKPQDRARALLNMFDDADAGILEALRAGMKTEAMAPGSLEEILAWPRKKLHESAAYFTEQTYKLLEERQVYATMRDRWAPILTELATGAETRVDNAMVRMQALADPQARQYSSYLQKTFAHIRSSYIDLMISQGGDRARLEAQPIVPARWQTFNRQLVEDREVPDLEEIINPGKAIWNKGPARGFSGDRIEMLHVGGVEAPLAIMSDLLYRMTVAPSYGAFKAITGVTSHSNQGSANTDALRSVGDNPGRIATLAVERGLSEDDVKAATSSARSIALMGQEIILKDLSAIAPRNRAMKVVSEFALVGALRALSSFSQIWMQTLGGTTFYTGTYNGLMKNRDFPAQLRDYLLSKFIHKPMAGIQKSMGKPETTLGKPFHEMIDELTLRYAPYIHARGADGNVILLDEASRLKPTWKNRPQGRVTGSLRPAVDAAVALPKLAHEQSIRLGKLLLEKSIASPEKVLCRNIFVHSLLGQVNQSRLATGQGAISMREMLRDHEALSFPPAMLQQAAIAVSDMMAEGDSSKKGALFQQTDSVTLEVLRGMVTTFANHPISIASNNLAAYRQLRESSDPETRAQAKRIWASNIGQNMMFVLARYDTLSLAIVSALAALNDWDDEEKQNAYGKFYGIDPENPDSRNGSIMRWVSMLAGGSTDPIGYDGRTGEWSDRELQKDIGSYSSRAAREVVNQIPLVGLFTSTTLGGSINQAIIDKIAMAVLPGDIGFYDRAGFVVPESLGGTGLGPQGEGWEDIIYKASQVFLNDVSDRSSGTMGLNALIDPTAVLSNTPDEIGALDAAMMFGLQAPFLPREVRRLGQRALTDELGAEIWDGSWKAR